MFVRRLPYRIQAEQRFGAALVGHDAPGRAVDKAAALAACRDVLKEHHHCADSQLQLLLCVAVVPETILLQALGGCVNRVSWGEQPILLVDVHLDAVPRRVGAPVMQQRKLLAVDSVHIRVADKQACGLYRAAALQPQAVRVDVSSQLPAKEVDAGGVHHTAAHFVQGVHQLQVRLAVDFA